MFGNHSAPRKNPYHGLKFSRISSVVRAQEDLVSERYCLTQSIHDLKSEALAKALDVAAPVFKQTLSSQMGSANEISRTLRNYRSSLDSNAFVIVLLNVNTDEAFKKSFEEQVESWMSYVPIEVLVGNHSFKEFAGLFRQFKSVPQNEYRAVIESWRKQVRDKLKSSTRLQSLIRGTDWEEDFEKFVCWIERARGLITKLSESYFKAEESLLEQVRTTALSMDCYNVAQKELMSRFKTEVLKHSSYTKNKKSMLSRIIDLEFELGEAFQSAKEQSMESKSEAIDYRELARAVCSRSHNIKLIKELRSLEENKLRNIRQDAGDRLKVAAKHLIKKQQAVQALKRHEAKESRKKAKKQSRLSQENRESIKAKLLSHVCAKGDVKLVEGLLRAEERNRFSDDEIGLINQAFNDALKPYDPQSTSVYMKSLSKMRKENNRLELPEHKSAKVLPARYRFTHQHLCIAAKNGHFPMVKFLCEKQGLSSLKNVVSDHDGETVLTTAVQGIHPEHLEIVKYLLALPNIHVDKPNKNGELPSKLAKTQAMRNLFSANGAQAASSEIPRQKIERLELDFKSLVADKGELDNTLTFLRERQIVVDQRLDETFIVACLESSDSKHEAYAQSLEAFLKHAKTRVSTLFETIKLNKKIHDKCFKIFEESKQEEGSAQYRSQTSRLQSIKSDLTKQLNEFKQLTQHAKELEKEFYKIIRVLSKLKKSGKKARKSSTPSTSPNSRGSGSNSQRKVSTDSESLSGDSGGSDSASPMSEASGPISSLGSAEREGQQLVISSDPTSPPADSDRLVRRSLLQELEEARIDEQRPATPSASGGDSALSTHLPLPPNSPERSSPQSSSIWKRFFDFVYKVVTAIIRFISLLFNAVSSFLRAVVQLATSSEKKRLSSEATQLNRGAKKNAPLDDLNYLTNSTGLSRGSNAAEVIQATKPPGPPEATQVVEVQKDLEAALPAEPSGAVLQAREAMQVAKVPEDSAASADSPEAANKKKPSKAKSSKKKASAASSPSQGRSPTASSPRFHQMSPKTHRVLDHVEIAARKNQLKKEYNLEAIASFQIKDRLPDCDKLVLMSLQSNAIRFILLQIALYQSKTKITASRRMIRDEAFIIRTALSHPKSLFHLGATKEQVQTVSATLKGLHLGASSATMHGASTTQQIQAECEALKEMGLHLANCIVRDNYDGFKGNALYLKILKHGKGLEKKRETITLPERHQHKASLSTQRILFERIKPKLKKKLPKRMLDNAKEMINIILQQYTPRANPLTEGKRACSSRH